jgi:toxin ParE1/3/4
LIRLSREADLRDIAAKIEEDNGSATAMRVLDRIALALRPLERFPYMGRQGRVVGTRELVVSRLPFIVVYQVIADEIAVSRIIHGATDWPPRS